MTPLLDAVHRKELPRSTGERKHYSTGFANLDALFPPGLVEGNRYAIAADSGTGKTTLFIQVAVALLLQGLTALYVSAEMSEGQFASMVSQYQLDRVPRMLYSNDFREVMDEIRVHQPQVVIIDSLQTLSDGPGGRMSYRRQAEFVTEMGTIAKRRGTIFLIILQVTKSGGVAGSNSVIHDVDVALRMERR